MFETLVTPNSQVRRLDPRILPVTVTVHAAALLLMMVVSVWKVEDLPVPAAAFDRPFIEVILPPQQPPAPARAAERQQVRSAETPAVPKVIQPEIVPPSPPETPQTATSVPLDDLTPESNTGPSGDSSHESDGPSGPGGDGEGDCTENCGDGPVSNEEQPVIIVPGILKPQVLHRVNPLYPEPARRIGKQGNVIVEAVIDTSGNVRDVRVLSRPLGLGLEDSAMNAVKQWRFSPATRNGKPVAVYFQLTVTFSLYR